MISKAKREKVYLKYGGHCAYCGKTLTKKELTVDHVMPSCKGGSDSIDNLRACCIECNRTKNQGNLQFLRLALAWPTIAIENMKDFPTALNAAKSYKFYYETYSTVLSS